MTYINPFAAALIPSEMVQKRQAEEKTRHIRQQQQLERDVAAPDRDELQIENADPISAVHDEPPRREPYQQQDQHAAPSDAEAPPHDVQAPGEGTAPGEADHIDLLA